jgi:AraC family transcriptional regulator
MNVLITRREPLKVIGMQIKTTLEENRIQDLWAEFITRMPELDDVAVPECSLGICTFTDNDDDEDAFVYMAARVVKNNSLIPAEMSFRELPAQEVAVFTHEGSLDNLSDSYDYIYNEWLPKSEYEIADADEIEWYDRRFNFGKADSQMDIHIPIRAKEPEDEIFEGLL